MTEQPQPRQPGCFTRFVLFLLALLLTFTLPLSLLLFNVARVVFNAELVKRVTADVLVDSDIILAGLEWYSEWRAAQRYDLELARPWEGEPDVVQLLTFLDVDDWRIIQQEVLLDEFVISWSGSAIDGSYAWIDSRDRLPTVTLDMAAFKERANGEHGERGMEVAYNALPHPCTEAQMADFLARLDELEPGEETLYNLCHFDPPWEEDQYSDYLSSLDETLDGIPDQWNLAEEMSASGQELMRDTPPERVKFTLRLIRAIMRWSILVPAMLLVLLIWISAGTKTGHGRWPGMPLLFGGLLALIIALLHAPLITWLVIAVPLGQVPPLALQEGTLFLLALARAVFGLMIMLSIILAAAGALLLVLGGRWFSRSDGTLPEELPSES